ncbi:hypothetical protein C8Q74DRAFT_148597 [Fomes fomentarius]|nr:hypothetical protein C8Q74DRAFT_148597 [Fomes fomentarius]
MDATNLKPYTQQPHPTSPRRPHSVPPEQSPAATNPQPLRSEAWKPAPEAPHFSAPPGPAAQTSDLRSGIPSATLPYNLRFYLEPTVQRSKRAMVIEPQVSDIRRPCAPGIQSPSSLGLHMHMHVPLRAPAAYPGSSSFSLLPRWQASVAQTCEHRGYPRSF